MNWELMIRLAGVGLLLVALANGIAPRMLNYGPNLAKCDRIVTQVFHVHAVYIVVTVVGMAVLCLWRPEFFLEDEVGRGMAWFLGLFWGSRFLVQMFYYDRGIKSRFPGWNVVFGAAFLALGVGFLAIALIP